ncbi:MAG: tail fiber domain-containing protein [Nitrosomonas sp.]|nr:tail fiber domain-containing protein [Nitrosomonas sp.]
MADHENDNKIQRLNYFTGQFLEAGDFQAEQNYHIGMRHLANRIRYSAGILDDGFRVTKKPDTDKTIEIGAGVGVDYDGKEIVILQPITHELSGFLPNDKILVLLRYAEEGDEHRKGAEDKEKENEKNFFSGYTRWLESPGVIAVKPGDRGDHKHTIKVAEIYLDQNGDISYIDAGFSAREYAKTLFHNQAAVFGETGSSQLKIDGRKIAALDDARIKKAELRIQPDGGTVYIGSFASGSSPLTISEGTTSTKGNVTLDVESLRANSVKGAVFTSGSLVHAGKRGSGVLLVGSEGSSHLAFDRKGIMSKANGTSVGTLLLQNEGGKTYFGGDLEVKGNVGIGAKYPKAKLHVNGDTHLNGDTVLAGSVSAGSNPLLFSSAWTGSPDTAQNKAEISNDTRKYKTLMIVGNKSAGFERRVSVWDRLEVNGALYISGVNEANKGGDGLLNIGGPTNKHLVFDDENIMAKASATSAGTLYLQENGGLTEIGGDLKTYAKVECNKLQADGDALLKGNTQLGRNVTVGFGFNPLLFSSAWTGSPDTAQNKAEISNDTKKFKTLMIVGNKSAGFERRVSVWDRLEVNGKLAVTDSLHISGKSDARVSTKGSGLLILGNTSGEHLALDQNEIMVKANATSVGTLYLQKYKGLTHIGGSLKVIGDVDCKKLTEGSDVRYKKDIEKIENALDKLIQLSGVMFHWKETKSDLNKKKNIGLIAQEVDKILPEVVSQDAKGYLGISYSSVIPVLIEAIKEMKNEIDKLTAIIQKK